MDILKILTESADSVYPEDLEFFETELATGAYNENYKSLCRTKIYEIRNWKQAAPKQSQKPKEKPGVPDKLTVSLGDLAPAQNNPASGNLTPEQEIFQNIADYRVMSTYKTRFKKYVAATDAMDARFVDKHYAFFQPWELDAIVSVRQMGEEFLEKYFGAVSHDKIARYQLFSEAFFMKHFAQLDAEIVLLHGKNPWRKKENRSRQLDVFLRLKGVKI